MYYHNPESLYRIEILNLLTGETTIIGYLTNNYASFDKLLDELRMVGNETKDYHIHYVQITADHHKDDYVEKVFEVINREHPKGEQANTAS